MLKVRKSVPMNDARNKQQNMKIDEEGGKILRKHNSYKKKKLKRAARNKNNNI